MDRVFLDADILFSASWRADAGLLQLWTLRNMELITSEYACEEARRNLAGADQEERLRKLISSVVVVGDAPPDFPLHVDLDEKDRPILRAAVQAGATHLLTGDKSHFGSLYGKLVGGVLILLPGDYLLQRAKPRRRRPKA